MKKLITMQSWIMTLLVMAMFLRVSSSARASVIAYDDLENATQGSISGQTSGTGFSAGYVLTSGALGIVTNKSLSYTGSNISVDGGTNCVMVGSPDKSPLFTRAIGTQSPDELYMSFLFETPTADGSAEDFLTLGFDDASAEPTGGIVHRLNSGGTDHSFGARSNGSQKMPNLGTDVDQTYFVVARLRKVDGSSSYNEVSVFVDPDSVYEPAVPTVVYTNSVGWSAATYLSCRTALMEAGDKYFLDNLCVGESYDDVVFPNGSPVVSTPTISPSGGNFAVSTMVTLSNETAGASIRYTTDGSTPSSTVGTLYTVPFTLSGGVPTVRAIAYKDGMFDSVVVSADFRVAKVWTGLGGDDNWSTTANWNTAGDPTGDDLVFGTDDRAATDVVNNIIDADITISSLSYTNSNREGSPWAHTTQIGTGVTLTIDGNTSPANAMFVGGRVLASEYRTDVTLTGGGNLVVDAEDSDFYAANPSSNHRGDVYLDMSGLNYLHASVENFYVGFGRRTGVYFDLPSFGNETNKITASVLVVGDSDGDAATDGKAELNLSRHTEIYADDIYVGALLNASDNYQVRKGAVQFQNLSAGATPTVRIRAKDGISRANLTMAVLGSPASKNTQLNRYTESSVDFTSGVVDALLGDVLIARHQAYATGNGAKGTLSMGAGIIDTTSLTLGRSIQRSSSPATAFGILNVTGGVFKTASMSLAENASSGGDVAGLVNVSGTGVVEVNGNITMGTRASTASSLVATVAVSNGTMTVLGNMAPASAATQISSNVILAGGELFVTNATDSATLRIESGTFEIAAGTATINNLVMTNTTATTQVTLSGIGAEDSGQVSVTDDLLLGGTLKVVLNGYAIHGGESWTVVSGTATRTTEFATTDLPEGMKLVYTENGYKLVCPAQGTVLIIR